MSKSAQTPIQIIKDHLDERAKADPQFAASYAKKDKSIDACFAFIIKEARKRASSNVCCMTDDEVFGLAIHYYDEDDINLSESEVKNAAKTAKVKTSATSKPATQATKAKAPKSSSRKKRVCDCDPNEVRTPEPKKQIIQLELFDFD